MRHLIAALSVFSLAFLVRAAHEEPASPYWKNASGVYLRTYQGLCWRTRAWTPDRALPECEGNTGPVQRQVLRTPSEVETSAPLVVSEPKVEIGHDTDEATISPSERRVLGEMARKIKAEKKAQGVLIIGHADYTGTRTHNQDLSRQRALNTRRVLVSAGVSPRLIKTEARGSEEALLRPQMCPKESAENCLADDRKTEVYLR